MWLNENTDVIIYCVSATCAMNATTVMVLWEMMLYIEANSRQFLRNKLSDRQVENMGRATNIILKVIIKKFVVKEWFYWGSCVIGYQRMSGNIPLERRLRQPQAQEAGDLILCECVCNYNTCSMQV